MAKVLVPLVDGFEEVEAVTAVDLLRRAGVKVITAGIGTTNPVGSHGMALEADVTLEEAARAEYDAIVLPGGPGTPRLLESEILTSMIRHHAERGKLLAAICAAPTVLASLGLLEGRNATCFPAKEEKMAGAKLSHEPVVVDGHFVTSRGAGTAVPFALKVAEHLVGAETAEKVSRSIIYT